MSREGVSIAARDRARRLQAALGEGAMVLMGCTRVVLHEAPRRANIVNRRFLLQIAERVFDLLEVH